MSLLGRIVTASLLAVCLVSGCSSRPPGYPAHQTSAAASSSSLAATATRGGELDALTARGLVNALNRTGFAAPKPVDTTAQECPDAGCDQSIVTDTLRVKSFSTTARAQKYASEHGLYQVETVVVVFAPPLPQAEQARYWAQIQSLMQ
jgi:hypothetical protein